jgi:succinyl-diaminopimelate desuccinylase
MTQVTGSGVPAADVIDSIIRLITRLVRTPSRAGIDEYEPVIRVVEEWMTARGIAGTRMHDRDAAVGIRYDLGDERRGARYVVDACLDTAPFGDPSLWRDEAYCGSPEGRRAVAGVMIGYPGDDSIVVGSRGFLRARITVHGRADHSGSRATHHSNAVERAAALVTALSREPFPEGAPDGFGLPPKLTVTAIEGGKGFSTVPDRCVVNVDLRLVPGFDATAAQAMLRRAVDRLDEDARSGSPSVIAVGESWPPYRLTDETPVVSHLGDAIRRVTGMPPVLRVCGPSNIGNYLATIGIAATAGFGVSYRDAHGTDERIDLSTIPTVYAVYLTAIQSLLGLSAPG